MERQKPSPAPRSLTIPRANRSLPRGTNFAKLDFQKSSGFEPFWLSNRSLATAWCQFWFISPPEPKHFAHLILVFYNLLLFWSFLLDFFMTRRTNPAASFHKPEVCLLNFLDMFNKWKLLSNHCSFFLLKPPSGNIPREWFEEVKETWSFEHKGGTRSRNKTLASISLPKWAVITHDEYLFCVSNLGASEPEGHTFSVACAAVSGAVEGLQAASAWVEQRSQRVSRFDAGSQLFGEHYAYFLLSLNLKHLFQNCCGSTVMVVFWLVVLTFDIDKSRAKEVPCTQQNGL